MTDILADKITLNTIVRHLIDGLIDRVWLWNYRLAATTALSQSRHVVVSISINSHESQAAVGAHDRCVTGVVRCGIPTITSVSIAIPNVTQDERKIPWVRDDDTVQFESLHCRQRLHTATSKSSQWKAFLQICTKVKLRYISYISISCLVCWFSCVTDCGSLQCANRGPLSHNSVSHNGVVVVSKRCRQVR